MAHKVIWADAAQEDLEAAAAYIYRDSPSYAASFVSRALKAARSLSSFPLRGRVVREFEDTNIREIFVFSYRLIYRVEKNRVSILSMIHGSRNFARAWDERDRDLAHEADKNQ
jgi:toxin ParE1/3/4